MTFSAICARHLIPTSYERKVLSTCVLTLDMFTEGWLVYSCVLVHPCHSVRVCKPCNGEKIEQDQLTCSNFTSFTLRFTVYSLRRGKINTFITAYPHLFHVVLSHSIAIMASSVICDVTRTN